MIQERILKKSIFNWHIGSSNFFDGLQTEKSLFIEIADKRTFAKGEMIFFENDSGDTCFYLEQGIVKIFRIAFSGKEPTFFLRRYGDFFGLAEIIESRPRKASAQTLTDCLLYEIGKKDFEMFLENNYNVARKIISVLGRRVRYLGELLGNHMAYDIATRLARLLIYIAFDEFTSQELYSEHIKLPILLTQNQIASMTGSCQQTISELLKNFEKEGLISVHRRKITIIDPIKILVKAAK